MQRYYIFFDYANFLAKKCIFSSFSCIITHFFVSLHPKIMLITTDAIVISLSRHNDRAMRLSAYTRHSGRMELMVYGAHSRKKGLGMLTPMQRIELVVDENPTRPIQTLKEVRVRVVPQQLPTDIRRQTIAIFMAEVISKTQRMPMKDERLFEQLDAIIDQLDRSEEPETLIELFITTLNRTMGYDIYSEVRSQLKSPEVLSTIL